MKGASETRLKLFRSFYQTFPAIRPTLSDESGSPLSIKHLQIGPTPSGEFKSVGGIRQTASAESRDHLISTIGSKLAKQFPLSWSHYVALLTVNSPEERRFYEIEAQANAWSLRELKRQINSSLYERLALSRDKDEIRRLAREGQIVERAADLIKNPYVLEFLGLDERATYSESELETAIIDKLEHFLLELGKGFLFEARQKRFTFDNDHYYVDLVFYNRLLRCYVLIDLKRDKLTHQDLGQMQIHPVKYENELRLCSPKPHRRKVLRRIHKRPQTKICPTRKRAGTFDTQPSSRRTATRPAGHNKMLRGGKNWNRKLVSFSHQYIT